MPVRCSVRVTGFSHLRTGLDDDDLDAVLAQGFVAAQAPPAQPVLARRIHRLRSQQNMLDAYNAHYNEVMQEYLRETLPYSTSDAASYRELQCAR